MARHCGPRGLSRRTRGKISGLLLLVLALAGCDDGSMVFVESTNQDSRIAYIVIHATAEDFAESLRLLSTPTDRPVSSHYLVPEINDPSYPRRALRVYSLVPEHRRARHAGVSYWHGEETLNDRSIGIEVVNEFQCTGANIPMTELQLQDVVCEFPPFSEQQIELVVDLLESILGRYPEIDPINIVAHADIAPMRRSDPGPMFPWEKLHQRGIGAWPDVELAAGYRQQFAAALPTAESMQAALRALGYQVDITGEYDQPTRFALRAFQLHFRPADYSGEADTETAALLWALLAEYRPQSLAADGRVIVP